MKRFGDEKKSEKEQILNGLIIKRSITIEGFTKIITFENSTINKKYYDKNNKQKDKENDILS